MPAYKKPFKPRVYKKKRLLKKKPVVSKNIKLYVKKAMTIGEELKSNAFSQTSQPLTIYDPALQAVYQYDLRSLFQSILQSAGAGGRIGNRINVTSCRLRGFVSVVGTSVLSNIWVRMLILRLKSDTLPVNGTLANLYQFGNNVLPPVGTLQDMIRDINTDYYTVYNDRKVLLGSSDSTTSTLAMNNTVGNCFFEFDLKKIFGGKIQYNDTATVPTNKSAFMIFVPCNANGTVITAAQIAPFTVSINTEVKYTDA